MKITDEAIELYLDNLIKRQIGYFPMEDYLLCYILDDLNTVNDESVLVAARRILRDKFQLTPKDLY